MLVMFCTLALYVTAALCMAEDDYSSEAFCRARGILLPESLYQLHTCALCYVYMNPAEFKPGMKWRPVLEGGIMKLSFTNITMSVNASTAEPEILQSFGSILAENKWRQCCQKAADCCREMSMVKSNVNDSSWCPRTWDGWLCWPDTPSFSASQRLCPSFIRFGTKDHNCELYVTKICAGEGHWSGHPRNQSVEWTDYSTCSVHGIMETRLYLGVAAYVITAVALLPALAIFHFYRQLHGHRIALHKNLFMSLLMNAVFETWFKIGVLFTEIDANDTGRPSIIKENGAYCKILLLHTKYFRLTNYMWMFCEGFYLHRLISAAFDEEKSLMVFYIIGWGFPLIPVMVYALLRLIQSDTDCWALPSEPSEWVLYIPSLLSLLVNTVFLIDIIRVLVMKLRAPHRREPSQYRKAVRATLVLVPLFGLHFAITMYRPQSGTCQWQELYVYLDILLDGLQGAVVALIFCYINSEVHALLKRSYRNFLELRNPSLSTGQCLGGSTATTTQTVF